jgi:UDP-N-acetylglucosamine enolpyruvyl transferase
MQTNKQTNTKRTNSQKNITSANAWNKTPQRGITKIHTNRNNKNANKHTNRNNKTHTNRNDKTKTNIKTQKTKNKHFLAFPTNHQSVFMSLVLLYIGNAKIKNVFQLPS